MRAELGPVGASHEFVEAALGLIARGVNVLPLRGTGNTKLPAIQSWKALQTHRLVEYDAASIDRYVREYWGEGRRGLAAVTGAVSAIVVIDFDDDDAWGIVADVCGGYPETVTARTPRGRHLWLTHPGGGRRGLVHVGGAGLDVRADGNYVVCPPSLHPSGRPYEWIVGPDEMWPPAPMPTELIRLLWPDPEERPHATPIHHISSRYALAALRHEVDRVRSAPEGTRNATLNKASFAVARFVLTGHLAPREAAASLLEAAISAGLSEDEATRTIESAFRARRTRHA